MEENRKDTFLTILAAIIRKIAGGK